MPTWWFGTILVIGDMRWTNASCRDMLVKCLLPEWWFGATWVIDEARWADDDDADDDVDDDDDNAYCRDMLDSGDGVHTYCIVVGNTLLPSLLGSCGVACLDSILTYHLII